MNRTCESTSGFDFGTNLLKLYNRGEDNEVGWTTTQLDYKDAHALACFCERLFKAGIDRGYEEMAHRVRAALPQEQPR